MSSYDPSTVRTVVFMELVFFCTSDLSTLLRLLPRARMRSRGKVIGLGVTIYMVFKQTLFGSTVSN